MVFTAASTPPAASMDRVSRNDRDGVAAPSRSGGQICKARAKGCHPGRVSAARGALASRGLCCGLCAPRVLMVVGQPGGHVGRLPNSGGAIRARITLTPRSAGTVTSWFRREPSLLGRNASRASVSARTGPLLATISLLLPLTYSSPTAGSLIMLAGIYFGAQYGDSVSAITMKIPHASSIVACIDGYQMTLKGKCGLALFTAGISSFIGGTVARPPSTGRSISCPPGPSSSASFPAPCPAPT